MVLFMQDWDVIFIISLKSIGCVREGVESGEDEINTSCADQLIITSILWLAS